MILVILVPCFPQISISNPDLMQKLKNKELCCFFVCVAWLFPILSCVFVIILCCCVVGFPFFFFFFPELLKN